MDAHRGGLTEDVEENADAAAFADALPSTYENVTVDNPSADTTVPVDCDYYRRLSKDELEQIQQDISNTIRPRWQSGPPKQLGTKGCGKLKADQWRSSIEFDIPVSLVKLWSEMKSTGESGIDDKIIDRNGKTLDSTMLLHAALHWATSYRTSGKHAAEYMKYMRAYLASLRDLFPNTDLRTCHHNALFIGEMLVRFGPIHGWWMFPFERIIGLLQQININYKMGMDYNFSLHPLFAYFSLGELEITMLKSFCAAANLRALVQSHGCPDIIQSCAHLLDDCYGQDQRGTLMNDLRTLGDFADQEKPWDYDRQKFDRIEPLVHEALVRFSQSRSIEGWTAETDALFHKEREIRGLKIAEINAGAKNTKGRHSIIFFQPTTDAELVPAVVRKIFSMPRHQNGCEQEAIFLAIHRYKPLSDRVADPFTLYTGFGARLWSEELGPVEIITSSQKICHAVSRPWEEGVRVLCAIDRVS